MSENNIFVIDHIAQRNRFRIYIPDLFFVKSITDKYDDLLRQNKNQTFRNIKDVINSSILEVDLPSFNYTPPLQQKRRSGRINTTGHARVFSGGVNNTTSVEITISLKHTKGFLSYWCLVEHYIYHAKMRKTDEQGREPRSSFGDIKINTLDDNDRVLTEGCVTKTVFNSIDGLNLNKEIKPDERPTFNIGFVGTAYDIDVVLPKLNLK